MLHARMEYRQHWVGYRATRSIYEYPSGYDDYYSADDDDCIDDDDSTGSIHISIATHNTGEPSRHHHIICTAYDHDIDYHYYIYDHDIDDDYHCLCADLYDHY